MAWMRCRGSRRCHPLEEDCKQRETGCAGYLSQPAQRVSLPQASSSRGCRNLARVVAFCHVAGVGEGVFVRGEALREALQ